MTPLEAMASRKAVVVSVIYRLSETLNNAAYFVNPEKPDKISDAMVHILSGDDLKRRLIHEYLN